MNQRIRVSGALALTVIALAGCGGDGGTTALDSGVDAATPDATAPDDGGSALDGGRGPGPITMARTAALSALSEVQSAASAVPEQTDADFLRTELLGVRLAGVIGEKSVADMLGVIGEKISGTISLTPAAIGALVIYRQLGRAIDDADRLASSGFGGSTAAEIVALRTALGTLRDRLDLLRDRMRVRYGVLIDGFNGAVAVDDNYVSVHPIPLVPEGVSLPVVCEGPASGGEARVEIDCGGALTPTYAIVDEETGAAIVEPTTGGTATVIESITLPSGRPTTMQVHVSGATATGGSWPVCTVTIRGTRRWRSSAIAIDANEARDLALGVSLWDDAIGTLGGRIEGGGFTPEDQATADVLSDYAAELIAESARWRGAVRDPEIDQEDYELVDLTMRAVVLPLGRLLEQHERLSSPDFEAMRTSLTELRTQDESARALLAPTHSSL